MAVCMCVCANWCGSWLACVSEHAYMKVCLNVYTGTSVYMCLCIYCPCIHAYLCVLKHAWPCVCVCINCLSWGRLDDV